MLLTSVYAEWKCVAMNTNLMSAIFISLHLTTLSPPLRTTPSIFLTLLTLPTYILNQVSPFFHYISALASFSLFLILLLFSATLALPFKLLICFGCMKWIAHRWPNFSVDFPKLISRCISVWIPNEHCVKIGKSLIRWNGGKKIPFPPPFFHPLWTASPSFHPPILKYKHTWDNMWQTAFASDCTGCGRLISTL